MNGDVITGLCHTHSYTLYTALPLHWLNTVVKCKDMSHWFTTAHNYIHGYKHMVHEHMHSSILLCHYLTTSIEQCLLNINFSYLNCSRIYRTGSWHVVYYYIRNLSTLGGLHFVNGEKNWEYSYCWYKILLCVLTALIYHLSEVS